jgi:hypothetical protein
MTAQSHYTFSPKLITNFAFGMAMAFLAILGIWQAAGYAAHLQNIASVTDNPDLLVVTPQIFLRSLYKRPVTGKEAISSYELEDISKSAPLSHFTVIHASRARRKAFDGVLRCDERMTASARDAITMTGVEVHASSLVKW